MLELSLILLMYDFVFFFNDTATTEIYTTTDTLSLHDALPICARLRYVFRHFPLAKHPHAFRRSEEHTSELQSPVVISYAVFCLKKKSGPTTTARRGARYGARRGGCPASPQRPTPPSTILRCFLSNPTAPPELYTPTDTLSLHDALPI